MQRCFPVFFIYMNCLYFSYISSTGKLSLTPSPPPHHPLSMPGEDQEQPEVTSSSDAAKDDPDDATSPKSTSSSSSSDGRGEAKRTRLEGSCNCEDLRGVTCYLETKELWEKFHDLGTEMIITKTGRWVLLIATVDSGLEPRGLLRPLLHLEFKVLESVSSTRRLKYTVCGVCAYLMLMSWLCTREPHSEIMTGNITGIFEDAAADWCNIDYTYIFKVYLWKW